MSNFLNIKGVLFKFIGESNPCAMLNGNIYEYIGEEFGSFRVIDEEGIDEDEDQVYLVYVVIKGDETAEYWFEYLKKRVK